MSIENYISDEPQSTLLIPLSPCIKILLLNKTTGTLPLTTGNPSDESGGAPKSKCTFFLMKSQETLSNKTLLARSLRMGWSVLAFLWAKLTGRCLGAAASGPETPHSENNAVHPDAADVAAGQWAEAPHTTWLNMLFGSAKGRSGQQKSLARGALAIVFAAFLGTALTAQTATVSTGSYIINMGVTPQTVGNGLKPYGMIYDLVKNFAVPVIWSINPAKAKDGIDFSHNGIDYRGGPFIIPAEYRTAAVNARITFWQGQGVVGATTVSSLTVPLFETIRFAPRWTLDQQNGSIATGYFVNAGIPASAHGGSSSSGWDLPASLDCCDDIFVMPHADPIWSTHQNLIPWNSNCKGAIWAACHATSALENMVNPLNRNQQSNFLMVKDPAWNGVSGSYSLSNTLILWGSHSDGTPPYSYRLPASPVSQFMGIFDAATQNGSEQICVPRQGIVANASIYSPTAVARWNPGANVIAYDPTQLNVTNPNLTDFRNVAALAVYGRGYDNSNNGWVMYQPAHSHNKGTAPENIAAQRAFFNYSLLASLDKVVLPDLSGLAAAFTSGTPISLSYTLPPGANPMDFTTQWSSGCGGTFSPGSTVNPTTFTPPIVTNPTSCIINVAITDNCGRTFNNSKVVTINPCVLTVNRTVTPPSCFGGSNGQISMSISGAPAPYGWNWSRVSPAATGSGTGTTISGLIAGTYNVTVTAGPACSATFSQLVSQPNLLTASATPTNYLCFGQTGAINLTVNGGTSPYTYNWADLTPPPAEPQNRSGLLAGSYNVTVTDANNCTAIAGATVAGPATAVAVALNIKTNVTCNGANNGTINITASGGTPGYTYLWSDGSSNEDRAGLGPGTYTVTVTDANGCTATLTESITQPAAIVLSLTKVDPTCPPGANPPSLGGDGSIDLTVSGGAAPYTYNWADLTPPPAEPQDRSSIPAGTYSVTVTDSNGCTASISTTLTPLNPLPATPSGINNN